MLLHAEHKSNEEENMSMVSSNASIISKKENERMNAEDSMSIRSINLPADSNENSAKSLLPLSHHQKLEAHWKKRKDLCKTTAEKAQSNTKMNQTITEESTPNRMPVTAKRRDKLSAKISLRKLLEFLC